MKSNRIILMILGVIAISMIVLLFFNYQGRSGQDETHAVPSEKNETKADVNSETKQEKDNYTILVSENVCEGCHLSGKASVPQALTVLPHQNGGVYCLSCHVINHEKHPMSNGVNCDSCHTGPEKPAYINGSIPCNNCHNYPDALSPSGGNIITIHRPRDVSCNKCHTDECRKCHSEIGSSARWEKRLSHFKVVSIGS